MSLCPESISSFTESRIQPMPLAMVMVPLRSTMATLPEWRTDTWQLMISLQFIHYVTITVVMGTDRKQMISIWLFIGLLLLAYGALIQGTGMWELFSPPQH